MNKIRPWLYIGKYRETLNEHLLTSYQIKAMLQLAELVEQPGITSLYLPVDDGVPLSEELLRKGIEFIIEEKNQERNVLIACGAGISRSSAFAIAALKEVEGLSLFDAFWGVRQRHPQAMPHFAIWESLCTHYQEQIPFFELFNRDKS